MALEIRGLPLAYFCLVRVSELGNRLPAAPRWLAGFLFMKTGGYVVS